MGVLRLLLAVCVLCAHSRPLGDLPWQKGDLAVELFFIISGFYMQLILASKYTRERLGETWVIQFYKARYFRLFPIYICVVAIVVLFATTSPESLQMPAWHSVWAMRNTLDNIIFKVFLCFTNATIFFQDLIMFLSVHNGEIHWSAHFQNSEFAVWHGLAVPQAWSLGIELSFYILAPFLLKLRSRHLVMIGVCCFIAKFAAIMTLHLRDPWINRFFPFELEYFLLGALAFRHRGAIDQLVPQHITRLLVYPIVILLSVLTLQSVVGYLVYPPLLACVLPALFRATSSWKMDRLIGELSYPFYVIHLLGLEVAGLVVHHWLPGSDAVIVWLALGLTLVASAGALALELRFLEPWRARFADRTRPRQAGVSDQTEPAYTA